MTLTKSIPFLILVLCALVALFVPESPPVVTGGPIDSGDTA